MMVPLWMFIVAVVLVPLVGEYAYRLGQRDEARWWAKRLS